MTHNQIEWQKHLESKRSNLAVETETNRHNVVTENETKRHNVADEGIRSEANAINRQHFERSDAEVARSNRAKENIQYANLYESARHNRSTEALGFGNLDLGYSQLAEAFRHNYALESNDFMKAAAQQSQADTAAVNADIAQQRQDTYDRLTTSQTRRIDSLLSSEVQLNSERIAALQAEAARDRAQVDYYGVQGNKLKAETDVINLNKYLDFVNNARDTATDTWKTFTNMFGGKKNGKTK